MIGASMPEDEKAPNPFHVTDLSFEEYRNQPVVETGDGEFFDALDEMFGIKPRTDELIEDQE